MGKQAFKLISQDVKAHACDVILSAPLGHVVEVKEPTRSLEQNARLHAMLTDISRQAEYMGKRRSVEFWKGLFVSGWQIATNQRPEIVPGLEGEFVNIRTSTTSLSIRALCELSSYIEAWAADNGIRFTAKEYEGWA